MVSLNNPKYYKQAVEFYNKGDYQDAYYNFGKIKKISPLYKVALFKQGICAESLSDYSTATKKYELLIKKYPKSIFIPKARYRLAKCYYYNHQYDEAKKTFLHVHKHSPVEDYVIASNYYLGMIEKKSSPQVAKKYFVDYISLSPKGTFALASAEELLSINADLTPYQSFGVGEVCFQNEKYKTAIIFLKKAKIEKSWPYLTISYKKLNMKPQAKAYFETGMKKYSRTISAGLLDEAIQEYSEILPGEKKQIWFSLSRITQEYKSAGEDFVLFSLAKYLDTQHALALYSRVAYKYPNSLYAPESLWNLFWFAYEKKDYKNAKKIGNEYLKRYSDDQTYQKMLFWMAKLALINHKNVEANNYLNKIMSKYPDDYYAFRAEALLKGNINGWGTKSYHELDERDFNLDFPLKYSNLDIKDLKLINTLLQLGDYEIWSELTFDNKFVQSWFEYKKGHKSKSTVLARNALQEMDIKPPFTDDVYKLAYPIYWSKTINTKSKDLKLDPYLIISIIREESYFNPESKSCTGALGLMQLMPSTASYIAAKYNLYQPTYSTLLNPEKNISLGSYYFKYIRTELDENDLMAIAAYNGGPNAVKYWQESLDYNDFDEFVENIPYKETKTYIKKVYRTYWNYLNIYNF